MDNLSTSYVDAVFTGSRKYAMTDNGDNTYSFTDETTYSQEGSRFGANDINTTNGAINKVIGTKTATLTSSGWTGTSAPFSQTVSVSGIVSTDTPMIALNLANDTNATSAKAVQKAWSYITKITTGSGNITAYAHTKPIVNIPIILKGV